MQGALRLVVLALAISSALPAASAVAFQRTGPVELGSAINDGAFAWGEPHIYRSTFLANHDVATHEHSMKMLAIWPERHRRDWSMADAITNWTIANRKKLHGHTLVWCRDEWNPSWVTNREWTRDELLAVMREHIRTVVTRYRGKVTSWDVVNEAFTQTGTREPCVWERYIGPDWIEQAFRAAAEADPAAKLFYNEWNADIPNARFRATEAMAKDFLARGVPLHGIGFQHHTYGSQPLQDRIEEAMARVAALGLAVHVSEVDVLMSQFPGTTEQKLAQQEQAYATIAAACQAQPACFRFTTWGFVDGIGFRHAAEMSAPFDTEFRPKPAWGAIQRHLRPRPAPAGNRAPSAPGEPAVSGAMATRNLTVAWTAASDPDGQAVSYRLEHRHADTQTWTPVATGIRGTSYAFNASRPERAGTVHYRVRADDGFTAGPWSGPPAPRTEPARPVSPSIAPATPAAPPVQPVQPAAPELPPPPIATDTSQPTHTRPTLTIRTTSIRARRGTIRVSVACASGCTLQLTARHGGRTVARSARRRLAPGTTARITLRLSKAARSTLRRRGTLRLTLHADGRRVGSVLVRRA